MNTPPRKPYPSDVSDDEWAFVAPYLTLMDEAAPQRRHDLREVYNGLRYIARGGLQWRLMPNDLPPWPAVYQQTRRWMAAGVFAAIVHDLGEVMRLAQGRTAQPAAAAQAHGIQLEVVKLPTAKHGFVLLPKRWVVERSFAVTGRFRRLARDYERLKTTLEGFHYVAFAMLALKAALPILALL